MSRRAALSFLTIAFFPAATQALSVQSLEANLRDGVYRIVLVARVDAPVEDVAAVLTDYAAYRKLDPQILASTVLPPDDQGGELVRTVVRACAGFFCRKVERVERVERREGELIATVVPERGELKSGLTRTTWQADDDDGDERDVPGRVRSRLLGAIVIGRRYAVRALKTSTLELFGNVEKRARDR